MAKKRKTQYRFAPAEEDNIREALIRIILARLVKRLRTDAPLPR